MPQTHTYHVTRNCLKHGRLFLSPAVRGLFPREGSVVVRDTVVGENLTLILLDAITVAGLDPFYKKHRLEPNDKIEITCDAGHYTLTPKPRPRTQDYNRPELRRELLNKIVDQVPLSESEIRARFADIPPGFDLGGALAADGRLHKYEGRWQRFSRDDLSQSTITVIPSAQLFTAAPLPLAPVTSGPQATTRARAHFERFGFQIDAQGQHKLLMFADLGRKRYSVLLQLVEPEATVDWARLAASKRALNANYVTVLGEHADMLRLHSAAGQAFVTFWSWQAVEKASAAFATVPFSPLDLEPYFQDLGFLDKGLRHFTRMVDERVKSRGDFSAVLQRLAAMRAPSVFLLDDLMVESGVSREEALSILARLSEAPFHLVSRVDHGEFCLRQSVQASLRQYADYALSLVERLPTRRGEQLQGQVVEVLGLAQGEDVPEGIPEVSS